MAGLLAAWPTIGAHSRLAAPLGAPHRGSPAVCDAHPGQPLALRSVSSLAMLSKSSLCGYVEEKRSHTLRAVTLTATATFRILLRIVPLWARASTLPASPYRRMISIKMPANTETYIRSWFACSVAASARHALAGLDEFQQVGDGLHVVGRGSSSAPDCSAGYRNRHQGALILVRALAEEDQGEALFRYSTAEGMN